MKADVLLVITLACFPALLLQSETNFARIEVFKTKQVLQYFEGDKLIKTYRVALGSNPKGTKEREANGATPEGSYYFCHKNPKRKFHRSLGISYPGPQDAERGFKTGLISERERKSIIDADHARNTPPWKTRLGGEIFIHDTDMAELFGLVPVGITHDSFLTAL